VAGLGGGMVGVRFDIWECFLFLSFQVCVIREASNRSILVEVLLLRISGCLLSGDHFSRIRDTLVRGF